MPDDTQRKDARHAPRGARGRRRAGVLLAAFVLGGVAYGTWRAMARARPVVPTASAGMPIVRGARVVARVDRVVRPRGRGRLPLYLAFARDAALDSARVGLLVPWLQAADDDPAGATRLALVPRDSVPGLVAVGRLVTTPGDPGVVLLGATPARR